MSWLARSIADSLRIDDDVEDDDYHHATAAATTRTTNANDSQYINEHHEAPQEHGEEKEEEDRPDNQGRGVKEDLSEFRETVTRQLWGVASFLAPPAQASSTPFLHQTDRLVTDRNPWDSSVQSVSGDVSDEDASDSLYNPGGGSDSSAIGGRYRNGNSNLSNFLKFRSEDQNRDAIGITEEVLAFARNIAHHPETWLDFPLFEEEHMDDFDMSEAQCKHVMAIERLAPRLAALRFELSPAHMSEGYFWKVYFVLLHSRLNKHDAELLLTPQLVSARAMWMQELQMRTKPEPDWFGRSTFYSKESANSLQEDFDHTSSDSPSTNMSLRSSAFEPTNHTSPELETEKHPVVSSEIHIIDKSVIEEERVIKTRDKEFVSGASYKIPVQDYNDDDDDNDWLDENSELYGYSGTAIILGSDEDVSFSDLEDDDDCTMPVKSIDSLKRF